MINVHISVTDTPSIDELAVLENKLSSFNQDDVGPADHSPIAVWARNAAGSIVGGISGYTGWGWLYVRWLWIAETHRGQGLTGDLLSGAEGEARDRGCHGAYIDTFNPVALKVYQRAGYVPFGELKDFPKGRTRTFLQKPL